VWTVTSAGWYAEYRGSDMHVVLSRGCLWVEWRDWGPQWWQDAEQRWKFERVDWDVSWPEDLGFWSPYFYRHFQSYDENNVLIANSREGMLPLWLVSCGSVVATGILWYAQRRGRPPGHCQSCGYDLTGNVSGVCPECGQKVAPMSHSEGTK